MLTCVSALIIGDEMCNKACMHVPQVDMTVTVVDFVICAQR